MKNYIALFCLSIIGYSCGAQQQIVDSLRTELKKHTANDTIRGNILLLLGEALTNSNPDSGLKCADEATEIAQKINWKFGVVAGLREAGWEYYTMSDFLNALDYEQKAMVLAKPLKDSFIDASLYNNIGMIYIGLSEYDKGFRYLSDFVRIMHNSNEKEAEGRGLNNIGLIFLRRNDFSGALPYFQKCLAISGFLHDDLMTSYALSNIGIVYSNEKKYDSAAIYYRKSILVSKKINNEMIIAASYAGLGENCIFFKKYGIAVQYLDRSLRLAKELNLLDLQQEVYHSLSDIYNTKHDFSQAFSDYKQYIAIRDSILNDEKKQAIEHKEMQFAFERKEDSVKAVNAQRAMLANAEIGRQRAIKNFAIGGICIIIIVAIAGSVLYKKRRDAEEQKKEAEFRAQVSDTEMKALRLQMNPHFIFNSLNSISDYISRNDIKSADHYLVKFAKVMRLILENSEQKEVSIADDMKALELYMQIEMVRLNNRFTYEIKISEDIDVENIMIPPLILQPFIENSIWHGIAGKEGDGKIIISVEERNGMLECIVEDNGIGRDKATITGVAQKDKRSLGMKITRSRIDILNKTKHTQAEIVFKDLEQGTRVTVRLPIEVQV